MGVFASLISWICIEESEFEEIASKKLRTLGLGLGISHPVVPTKSWLGSTIHLSYVGMETRFNSE
jgi:hypothetical protein